MSHAREHSNLLQALRWPLLVAVMCALFLIVGVSTIRETYHVWQVNQEIGGLQAQVDALEGRKGQLKELINRLGSIDELDKQARTRFGLQKPGEHVIVLRNADGQPLSWQNRLETVDTKAVDSHATQDQSLFSNPKRWLAYFFPTPSF